MRQTIQMTQIREQRRQALQEFKRKAAIREAKKAEEEAKRKELEEIKKKEVIARLAAERKERMRRLLQR